MKEYIVTIERYNPQLSNTYLRTTKVEARTLSSAQKKAQKIVNRPMYGTEWVKDVQPA